MSLKSFKVALVCSTLNQLGGPAAHIRNIYTYLNGGEFRLTLIFCSQNEKALRDFMLDGGVKKEDMLFVAHAGKKTVLPFVFELRDIFRRENFDIVHAFETQTQVLAGWAAALAGVNKFIGHCEAQFLPSTISWPKRVLFRGLNLFLRGYFTKTVAVSSGLQKELLINELRPKEKVQLIHLGIVVPQGDGREFSYPGLVKGTPVIGAISRLSIEKGLDRFVRVMPFILKDIPAARFVVYGEGVEKEALISLAQELGVLQRVEFKPWVKDIGQALQRLDIFVMPSHREGLPITLLEAMSMGRPCVASDIEGMRDIVNNGINGVLVDTGDGRSFADGIITLCRNPSKAAAMGRAGAEKVRTYFNIEREASDIRKLYKEILA